MLQAVLFVGRLLPALAATSPNSCTCVSGDTKKGVGSMIQEVTPGT